MYGMCCCDPPTCTLVSDDSTLSNFTQETGTWTKPATYIETTSANGIILHNTVHPDGLSTGVVTFDEIVFPAAGGKVRILFAYLDSDNYLFQEYEVLGPPGPTAGVDAVVYLGYRQGGADTYLEECGQLQQGGGGTTEGFLTNQGLCYNDALISGTIGSLSNIPVRGMDSPASGLTLGTKVGLQVIGNAGTVKFKNINFYGDNSVSCFLCTGGCNLCSMGISGTPSEYSVYLTGVAEYAVCGLCVATYDGMTFVLDGGGGTAGEYGTRTCGYGYTGGDCSLTGPLAAQMTINIGGNGVNSPTLTHLFINHDARFDIGRTANACNETLSALGTNVGSANQRCDWTGCTATITPNMA